MIYDKKLSPLKIKWIKKLITHQKTPSALNLIIKILIVTKSYKHNSNIKLKVRRHIQVVAWNDRCWHKYGIDLPMAGSFSDDEEYFSCDEYI